MKIEIDITSHDFINLLADAILRKSQNGELGRILHDASRTVHEEIRAQVRTYIRTGLDEGHLKAAICEALFSEGSPTEKMFRQMIQREVRQAFHDVAWKA